jgi:hypothetical protein
MPFTAQFTVDLRIQTILSHGPFQMTNGTRPLPASCKSDTPAENAAAEAFPLA